MSSGAIGGTFLEGAKIAAYLHEGHDSWAEDAAYAYIDYLRAIRIDPEFEAVYPIPRIKDAPWH